MSIESESGKIDNSISNIDNAINIIGKIDKTKINQHHLLSLLLTPIICNLQYANREFMRKHAGMRPQDVPILLKILSYDSDSQSNWQMKQIAHDLQVSPSEISESLNRSFQADLISQDKRRVNRLALLEFLEHGIKYVFPQKPGSIVRGIKTAHSAPPLDRLILSNDYYVWPSAEGDAKGQAIEPLYPSVVNASKNDSYLYECLALIDAIRVGRVREQEAARKELSKLLQRNGKQNY